MLRLNGRIKIFCLNMSYDLYQEPHIVTLFACKSGDSTRLIVLVQIVLVVAGRGSRSTARVPASATLVAS